MAYDSPNDDSPEARGRSSRSQRHAGLIKPIITVVLEYARRYCGAANVDTQSPPSPISPEVSLSILALGSTIANCSTEIFGPPHFPRYLNFRWPSSALLEARLLHAGWCPRDVSQFLDDLDIDAHYYLASFPHHRRFQNHSACTKGACIRGNIELQDYSTRHVTDGCDCKFWEAEGITNVIAGEDVRLVRWREGADPPLEVIPMEPIAEYVSISHVYYFTYYLFNSLGHPMVWITDVAMLCLHASFLVFKAWPTTSIPTSQINRSLSG
jgi:hypothetical protein